MKAQIILNEQHQLLPDQVRILNKVFGKGGWVIYPVPSIGWPLEKQKDLVKDFEEKGSPIVFTSPVPYLLGALVKKNLSIFLLHNDFREKKELPNGKIIMTVAKIGWRLVSFE